MGHFFLKARRLFIRAAQIGAVFERLFQIREIPSRFFAEADLNYFPSPWGKGAGAQVVDLGGGPPPPGPFLTFFKKKARGLSEPLRSVSFRNAFFKSVKPPIDF